jgi:hypothetical protein
VQLGDRSRGVERQQTADNAQTPARARDVGKPYSTTTAQTPDRGSLAVGLARAVTTTQALTLARALAILRAVTSSADPSVATEQDGDTELTIDVTQVQTPSLLRAIARAFVATQPQAPTAARELSHVAAATAVQTPSRGALAVGLSRAITAAQSLTRTIAIGLIRAADSIAVESVDIEQDGDTFVSLDTVQTQTATMLRAIARAISRDAVQTSTAARAVATTRAATTAQTATRQSAIGRALAAVGSQVSLAARALGLSRSATQAGTASQDHEVDTGALTFSVVINQVATMSRAIFRALTRTHTSTPTVSMGGRFPVGARRMRVPRRDLPIRAGR